MSTQGGSLDSGKKGQDIQITIRVVRQVYIPNRHWLRLMRILLDTVWELEARLERRISRAPLVADAPRQHPIELNS
jgi:hypothetical protein